MVKTLQPIITPRLPVRSPAISHLLRTATSIDQLKQLHAQLIKQPHLNHHLNSPPFLSSLLSLSLSCSSLHYCLSFFLSSPAPRRLLISALHSVEPHISILAYSQFRCNSVPVDEFFLSVVLHAVAKDKTGVGDFHVVSEAHGFGVKTGFYSDPFVQTDLVRSYASVGRLRDERKLFDRMLNRDLIAWSVMMDRTSNYKETIYLFEEMKSSGLAPDPFVLSIVLSACTRAGNFLLGKELHSCIIESDLSLDVHLQNSLIIMYSACGQMNLVETIYNNLVSPKNLVATTSMIVGYAKLGQMETAHHIFDGMTEKDLVSWSAMISGYAESDRPDKAFNLFKEMKLHGFQPDEVTMLGLISACSNLGAIDHAKQVHIYVKNLGLDKIISVGNALIDMFAKCGSLADACKVFEQLPRKNIITWTSMITSFAIHGDGKSALALFERMKDNGIKPNHVTFVSLLYACSHAGLIKEGQSLFESMVRDYNIEPRHEHYGCMVDLYGRSKLFKEAVELIGTMPFQPNEVVWGSLLGACKIHGEVELGELAAKRVLELNPDHDGACVLLSNIYAKAGRSDDARRVRENMKFRGLSKERGYSWLELNGTMHSFLTGDNSHPQRAEIYEKLRDIVTDLETIGYSLDTGCASIDADEEEKRESVLSHSEKLALTFGLINSRGGECVRISKNLRICEDCHRFVKLVSRVYNREIVLRDRTRFHHFQNGSCSCGDFW